MPKSVAAPRALLTLQRWLADAILDPDRAGCETFLCEVRERLVCDSPHAVVERLGAHTGGYPARLGEALGEAYPAIAHLCGRRRFADLVTRYRRHVPCGGYNLSEVGANLAHALERDPLAEELPFLSDLARLEWAVHRAFHAEVHAPFKPCEQHAAWTIDEWQHARIVFQPSVAVVRSRWPILDLWRARHIPLEEIDVALEGRPQAVRVHRIEWKVACEPVSTDEAELLDRMLAGATLGAALTELAERHGLGSSLANWLADWSAGGLIADVVNRDRVEP